MALSTVQLWLTRAGQQRLERVAWTDRSHAPLHPPRTATEVEDLILSVRRQLHDSPLGECGAAAIHRELLARGLQPPVVRTIGRILERRGCLDGRRRLRRPPPPPGWYLPSVAAKQAELDAFDFIEDLKIKDGPLVDVFTTISLHGALAAAWPATRYTAAALVDILQKHWRNVGLPAYAQFDNDTRFQGPHQFPDTVGRVARFCLSLGVVPVFVPPHEFGFQAHIESFNGRWQSKVWTRYHHASLKDLRTRNDLYVTASRQRHAERIDQAPPRRLFPKRWRLNLQASLPGTIIYLRRSNAQGVVHVLGHRFALSPHWLHRLVRIEFDLDQGLLSFFALRRRDPDNQPCLKQIPHTLPKRYFHE